MDIETLQVGDNYIYVLIEGDRAAVVDPGVSAPVTALLRERGLTLELILITHYHGDHTGGVAALRQAADCRVAGPSGGAIGVDPVVHDGEVVGFAGHVIEVLEVVGHTDCDVAYYLPAAKALFTGDVLFSGGCGRVLGGQMAQMWLSILKLRALPDDTYLYGGHDYTIDNLEFAAHLEPDNRDVRERLVRVETGDETAATLAEEKRTNPFLRCDSDAIAEAIGRPDDDAAEVFAAVRRRKDRW